jgi:RimK family alpha-L-glutamate ligase
MKKALILINAYMQLQSQFSQAERIKAELEKLGVKTDILRNDGFFARIEEGEICVCLPEKYDFCVYLDKDKYTLQMLEKSGVKLFNSYQAIEDCDDKMQTYIALSGKGVPMVKTLSGLLCYSPNEPIKEETLDKIESALSYPVIVKECFGSLGKGVYMAKDRAELKALAEQVKCRPHLFQKTVQTSVGKDIRVIVIGGKYLCAMLRFSSVDFRSNVELGGKASAYQPSEEVIALCEKTAQILGLDYCGIDVLFGEDGPLICEVNSNAFFGGMEQCTGINVAKAYAEYIYNKVYGE